MTGKATDGGEIISAGCAAAEDFINNVSVVVCCHQSPAPRSCASPSSRSVDDDEQPRSLAAFHHYRQPHCTGLKDRAFAAIHT